MNPSIWSAPIDAIKQRVYLVVLPFAAFVCCGLWWLEASSGSLHIVDRVGLPLFSLLCLGLLLALRRWPRHLAVYELILFCAFTLFYLASLSYSLSTVTRSPLSMWNLAGLTYWGPVLYTLAFLVFGVRRGLFASLGVHGIVGFTSLSYVLQSPDSGAAEMLLQGFAAGLITVFLLWAIGGVVTAQTRDAARLEQEAGTDPLTLLSNRRRVWQQLQQEGERASRLGSTFSLAFLDPDFFKRINDTHGHAVGDEVLNEVSQLLRAQTRSIDTVGRWGGEEFVLLLPGLSSEEATEAVERLRQVIATHVFQVVGRLTVSAGVAVYQLEMPIPLDDLLLRADRALYQAKEAGRNQVAVAREASGKQEAETNELLN